jgi:hypothetical protein
MQFSANREELLLAVERDQLRAKPKFCVKLIRVLRYTASHPGEVGAIGCGWHKDRIHFICNSQILGNFLKLKPNSINTNLRDHGFVIDSVQISDLIPEFGSLPDAKNWKVRHNNACIWNTEITDNDADRIPAREAPVRAQLELVTSPASLFSRMTPEREEVIRDIQSILKHAIGSAQWKDSLLKHITEQWMSLSADGASVEHSVLLRRIFESANPHIPKDSVEIVDANLRFLIAAESNASQMAEGIALLDFVRLTLRFGLIEQIAHSIYEISSTEPVVPHPFFMLSLGSQSQREINPCFAPWFMPSSDRNATAQILRDGIPWIVRMSSSPNCFTLEAQNEDGRLATHIRFDPISVNQNRRFLVDVGGEEQGSDSWAGLLANVLGLEVPVFPQEPLRQEKVKFVGATALIAAIRAGSEKCFGADSGFRFRFENDPFGLEKPTFDL